MPSVLAIVSKAVFDEDGGEIGDVLPIDRYVSKLPVFKKIGKGDAVFLVTVRPGNVLWRIAIIEAPKKKGKAWVGKKNKTPIADASSTVDALKFESGNGVGAAKNALGMALQTPRRLTEEDVALLRALGTTSAILPTAAVAAYRDAASEVPAAKRAREEAEALGGSPLELVNKRYPFRRLVKLPKPQLAQLTQLTTQNRAGQPRDCVDDESWRPMELVDVCDKASGAITHQLYVWPWGSGAVFENDSPIQLAAVIQHAYQMNEGDLELRRALAGAYAAAPLSEVIDFRLNEIREPPAPPEPEPERPKGPLEEIVGSVPAWQLLKDADDDAIHAAFDAEKTIELAVQVCTQGDAHDLFDQSRAYERGESDAIDFTAAILQRLGALVDRAGAATAFAERAEAELAKGAQFWLAAIASFALAKNARRSGAPFPKRWLALAAKSDFLGSGVILGRAFREVVETIAPEDRAAFIEEYSPGAGTSTFDEIKNGREYEKPCLLHLWWFADLVPNEVTAGRLVATLADWDGGPSLVDEALAVVAKVPACAPLLSEAIENAEPRHRKLLARALALFSPPHQTGKKKTRGKKRGKT